MGGSGGIVGGLSDVLFGETPQADTTASATSAENLAFQKDIFSKYSEPQLKELSKSMNLLDLQGQAVSDIEKSFGGAEQNIITQFGQMGLDGSGVTARALSDLSRSKAEAKAGARRGARQNLFNMRSNLAGLAPSTTGGVSSAFGNLAQAQANQALQQQQIEAGRMQAMGSIIGTGIGAYGAFGGKPKATGGYDSGTQSFNRNPNLLYEF